jgi:8-oxo-dGTP pyrophosphatase MutT (NUDIX family)
MSKNPDNLREIDRPIASVVIISNDGKILMGRKDPSKGGVYPDAWHIPGGGIDEDESLEAAARREAFEEVGIDLTNEPIKLLPFVDKGGSPKTLPSGEKVWCNMVFNRFEARLSKAAKEIEVKPTDDLVELRWFDENEFEDVQLVPGGREFFIEAGYIKADKE